MCAPAGALEGTAGFLARAAAKALEQGFTVVAFTDRAIPGVALGRLRNDEQYVALLLRTYSFSCAYCYRSPRRGRAGGGT